MSTRDTTHRIGDTFHLPLDELVIDVGENMREVHDPGLRELAESMSPTGVGQLQPILVVWREGAFHVAAGFRRAMAMRTHQKELGFSEILARRIRIEDAEVARLVENLERENPSTFETCKYLFELREGIRGPGLRVADLAAATGKSVRHIDNLIRFYRVMPERLRKLWAADTEQRFTFAVLRELAIAAQADDGKAVEEILRRALGPTKPAPERMASPPAPASRPGIVRRLGHATTAKLQKRLEGAGIDRVHSDDRAELVYDLLRAINGEVEAKRADAVVDLLLFDLGALKGGAR
ncbi:MAG: ParB N-terminal domain-containing protein [Myxococcota bacterium]